MSRWVTGLALVSLLLLHRDVSAAPPNVVMLFADDLSRTAVHCYGNEQVATPNIDALARRGSLMRNAYVMGAMQGAVCVPSRAMLFSGRSLFRISEKLDQAEHELWPETMRKAGYSDFFCGKWHNGAPSFARAFSAGDSIFFGGMADQRKTPLFHFQAEKQYPKESQYASDRFATEIFADNAIGFIRSAAKDRPFYLHVSFTTPHDPRQAPAAFHAKYPPAEIKLPASYMPEHPFDNGELKIRDEKLAAFPRTKEEVRQHLSDYYAAITHLDAEIGRILATLAETGRLKNTIVVFAADNGLAVGRHGLMGKQNLYEHSIGVPFIAAGPGVPVGREFPALTYLYDIFPTVCDLAGITVPASVDGKSLVPIWQGEEKTQRTELLCAYRNLQRSLRNERWKVIEYPQAAKTQLFDLTADPEELHDLSGRSEHAAVLAELRSRLAEAQATAGDPLLAPKKGRSPAK